MVKIFIDRNEPIASVVEKVIEAEDSVVALVIPRGALLKESVSNFHLLRRESAAVKKTVVIESVDDEILALAKVSKLEATHPLFRKDSSHRSLSDIVPSSLEKEEKKLSRGESFLRRKEEEEDEKEEALPEEAEEETVSLPSSLVLPPQKSQRTTLRISLMRRLAAPLAVLILLMGGSAWVMARFFSEAEITIDVPETPWQYDATIIADKRFSEVKADENSLPAELFIQPKGVTLFFPASGRREVEEKATGKIVIYNAYSSESQPLVATTRFATPDGKIFRLDRGTVVPGAQVKDGKIIPSSIEAAVTADRSGPSYNVGPVERLTVPGLKGTPKYEGFYGQLEEPTRGGFSGEKAVPTDQDIAAGKEKIQQVLKTALESDFLSKLPAGFKILEEASDVAVTKVTVNKNTDEKGNFSVFGEAERKIVGFREADIISFLEEAAASSSPDHSFRSLNLRYSKVTPDFAKGRLTFSLKAEGVREPAFRTDSFKNEIAGKKIKEVKPLVKNVKALSSAKVSISLWPFWLQRIPSRPGSVTITVQ